MHETPMVGQWGGIFAQYGNTLLQDDAGAEEGLARMLHRLNTVKITVFTAKKYSEYRDSHSGWPSRTP
jgi:hypothetical protein